LGFTRLNGEEDKHYLPFINERAPMSKRNAYASKSKCEAVFPADTQGNLRASARELSVHSILIRRPEYDLASHNERAFPGPGTTQDEELARQYRKLERPWKNDHRYTKETSRGTPPFLLGTLTHVSPGERLESCIIRLHKRPFVI
jgi:hypothetical protein